VTFTHPRSECAFTVSYEQLRSGVLDSRTAGGHFGLVILIREGVAAWMANTSLQPMPVAHMATTDPPAATALIPDGLRADVVRVFANMVMTTPKEKCA